MKAIKADFATQSITSWEEFHEYVLRQNTWTSKERRWIYRGQTADWPLTTTIERALFDWNIALKNAPAIEFQTIREFRRRLRDPQHARVHSDTLFCLALMQHHGAPTRLLDCTYSPFVAAAFAMEKGPEKMGVGAKKTPVVWCFRGAWLQEEAGKNTPHKHLFDQRADDAQRSDHTFLPLYQLGAYADLDPRVQFVKAENPLHLNERLTAQQGVFLCPADLKVTLAENLEPMTGSTSKDNVVKHA